MNLGDGNADHVFDGLIDARAWFGAKNSHQLCALAGSNLQCVLEGVTHTLAAWGDGGHSTEAGAISVEGLA